MRGKREVSCRRDVGIGTRCDGTTSQCAWRQGSRMDTWVWGGGVTRCDMTAIRWTRGEWEERRQRTRGGGATRGGGGASWGRGAAVVRRRRRDERTRGGGSATTGATWQPAGKQEVSKAKLWGRGGNMTTSWQPRGKCEGRCQWTRGGRTSIRWEVAAAQWEASQQSAGGGNSFWVKYHTIPYYWHQECRGMCVWPILLLWTLSFRNFRCVNIWTARQSWVWYFARLLNMGVYI
jgi:hypothetical protein